MLFKKSENESATLEQEKAELDQKINEVTRQIHFLPKPPDPRELERLQQKRADLMKNVQPIEKHIEEQAERNALTEVQKSVNDNHHDIIVKVDGNRIKPNENGEVVIRHNCGHELKLPVYELFRHQTRIDTNRKLLSFWNNAINNHETNSKIYTCERCRRERAEYLRKHHVIPNKRSGTARLTIEVI